MRKLVTRMQASEGLEELRRTGWHFGCLCLLGGSVRRGWGCPEQDRAAPAPQALLSPSGLVAPPGKGCSKGKKRWTGRGEAVKAKEQSWSTQIRGEGGEQEVLQVLAGAGIPLRQTTVQWGHIWGWRGRQPEWSWVWERLNDFPVPISTHELFHPIFPLSPCPWAGKWAEWAAGQWPVSPPHMYRVQPLALRNFPWKWGDRVDKRERWLILEVIQKLRHRSCLYCRVTQGDPAQWPRVPGTQVLNQVCLIQVLNQLPSHIRTMEKCSSPVFLPVNWHFIFQRGSGYMHWIWPENRLWYFHLSVTD